MLTNIGHLLPKEVLSMETGTEVMKAVRSTHSYPSLPQNILKAAERHMSKCENLKRKELPNNYFGAVRGRQREEAIGIQMMNHEACRRNNKNNVLVLHDVTNAFRRAHALHGDLFVVYPALQFPF